MNAFSDTTTDEQPTPLEIYEQLLTFLRLQVSAQSDEPGEGTGNFWLHNAIDLIDTSIRLHFDPETGERRTTPQPLPEYPAIVPAEAMAVSGYTEIGGLQITKARGPMGGHGIRSRIDMAARCIDDPESMVAAFGGSLRIYPLIGHLLNLLPWHYIPTHYVEGRWNEYEVHEPEVPYTDEEKRLWAENFERFHFAGAALVGAKLQSDTMLMNPLRRKRVPGETPIQLIGYQIWTAVNRPDAVIERMVDLYETTKFLRRLYATAVNLAHAIDGNRAGYVPGYQSPDEVGGEHSQAWYRQVGENKQSDNWPTL